MGWGFDSLSQLKIMETDMTSNRFLFLGAAIPKPRMTMRDKWAKRPIVLRYFEYKDRLKLFAKSQRFELGDSFEITFVIEMPESWSKVKKETMNGKPHQSRPDIDNLVKGVMDAMMKQDMTVWNIKASKVWGTDNSFKIQNL